jgi:hypothetical protein
LLSGALIAATGIEGGWRAVTAAPPGRLAERLGTLYLIALVVASAGGLGLLLGGSAPSEPLHFVYAIVALGILPLVDSLSRGASARARGLATGVAALVLLVVLVRLFATG